MCMGSQARGHVWALRHCLDRLPHLVWRQIRVKNRVSSIIPYSYSSLTTGEITLSILWTWILNHVIGLVKDGQGVAM